MKRFRSCRTVECRANVSCPWFIIHISGRLSWQGKESPALGVRKLLRRNQIVACLLLVLFVAGCASSAGAQSEKLGLLRIRAEYPVQVPRSYTFEVKLTVEYAFRDYFEINAGIYEGPMGTLGHPLWEGETERLIDVGERTYNVQLKSPAQDGQWILTGYAFYHDTSGPLYFTDQERGPGFIEMSIKVADNAKLTLRTPHGNMAVSVDGAEFSTDQNGILVREFKVLTQHSIQAPETALVAEGWRAVFRSWNGTTHENPKTLLINTDLLMTVEYQDEFRLDVVSGVSQVAGAGWYPAGAVANFSAPMYAPLEGPGGLVGIRSRFTGWSGDIVSTANRESVVMDRPYKVVANWIVDYEQFYYVMIVVAILAVGGIALFIGLRITKKRPEEPVALAVRTHCMFCGAEIDPDAKFCSKCGKDQVSSGERHGASA